MTYGEDEPIRLNAHFQAGIVAFVGGLAVIDAQTAELALMVVLVCALVSAVILIAGKVR